MNTNKLHTIKNTGFKVPENYFASLENRLSRKVKLQETTPQSGYKVPDTYFNSLEDKIINTLHTEKETKVIKLITWPKALTTTAVAASLVLMMHLYLNKPTPITINNIETASIENYMIEEDLEINEFAALFSNEDLVNIQLINDGYSTKNLENYLLDNLDYEDIIKK